MSIATAPFAAHSSRGTPLVTPTGDQAIVLANAQKTSGSLTVIELANQPKNGPPLHSHVSDDKVWYVLEGEYRFKAGEAMFRVSEGGIAFGPHGMPHCFQNVGDTPARLLIITTPRRCGAILRGLRQAPTGANRPGGALRARTRQWDRAARSTARRV